jgi:hypothetical protein
MESEGTQLPKLGDFFKSLSSPFFENHSKCDQKSLMDTDEDKRLAIRCLILFAG